MNKAMRLPVLALAFVGCQPGARDEPPRPDLQIGPEICARVRPGMTGPEVEAAIGGPPGFYEGTVGIAYDPGTGPRSKKGDESWTGRRGTVEVRFDREGKALQATWHPAKNIWLR